MSVFSFDGGVVIVIVAFVFEQSLLVIDTAQSCNAN
jgi:hypothetical protein